MKDAKWHHSTRDRLEEEPIKLEEKTTSSGSSGSSMEQKKKKPTKKQQKQEELQIQPQQCMKQLIQMVRYESASERGGGGCPSSAAGASLHQLHGSGP